MTTNRYPLATSSWGEEEIRSIHRVIESRNFTMGAEVQALEREFATVFGSKYCVMVNSGSSANLIMVGALMYRKNNPLLPGDEVIVPAVSWPTTYYPLHQYGLKLRFVDIDLQTLNYDLDALQKSISAQTRAIMCVNLLGNPNDFDRIREMTADRNITLIEDNCESMGASFGGKQAGTLGLMGTYSSFFSHHISTMEGGFVVTDDEEIHHILLCLRAHGWTRNLPKNNHVCGVKSDNEFEESFRFVLPGYNVRPLEIEAAIGREQIKKVMSFVEERRTNARRFMERFANHPHLIFQKEIGRSSWFGFSMVIKPGSKLTREELVAALQQRGIECRPIVAGNFAKNPVVKLFQHDIPLPLTNSEHIDRFGLFVGNHHYSLNSEFDALAEALGAL
jgi:CDP-6-deoxy-D-xylo-4-hexulose-3-dehydrase